MLSYTVLTTPQGPWLDSEWGQELGEDTLLRIEVHMTQELT